MRRRLAVGAITLLLFAVLALLGYRLWVLSGRVTILEAALSTPTIPDTPEVLILRAQLALLRQSDERMLQTVFWSLTVVSGIAVLLAGFGWYANFRLYERDKEIIRKELQGSIQTEMTRVLEAAVKTARDAADQSASKLKTEVAAVLKSLRRDVKSMQYEFLLQQADRNETAGYMGSSLLNLAWAGEITLELGEGWKTDEILDRIVRLLNRGAEIDASLTSTITELIQKLPPQYAPLAAKIRTLMSS